MSDADKIVNTGEYIAKAKEVYKEETGFFRRNTSKALGIAFIPVKVPVAFVSGIVKAVRGTEEPAKQVYVEKDLMDKVKQNPFLAVKAIKNGYMSSADIQDVSKKIPLEVKLLGLRKAFERSAVRTLAEVPDHAADLSSGKLVKFNTLKR